jgi:photosystem II stability/assembly factor-like uncharacterized protein
MKRGWRLCVGDEGRWRPRFAWVVGALLVVALASLSASPPAQAGPAWLPMSSPSGLGVSSVDFVNADEGWVVGFSRTVPEDLSAGSVVRTRDGGAHWESVYGPDPDLEFGPVYFLDGRAGWVIARDSRSRLSDDPQRADYYVLRTSDGGTTWTKAALALGFEVLWLNDIVFANPSAGFVVGSGTRGIGAVIFRTSDGGATWQRYDAEEAPWSRDGIRAASFVDAENGWAVAGWYSRGWGEGSAILHTGNGGLSWERQYGYETEPPAGEMSGYSAVDFVDAAHGWVVGNGGLVLRTRDGGLTWHEQICWPSTSSTLGWAGWPAGTDSCFTRQTAETRG